jgi:hypothetical protein
MTCAVRALELGRLRDHRRAAGVRPTIDDIVEGTGQIQRRIVARAVTGINAT